MVKSELIHKLCNLHPNMIKKDIEKILDIVFSEITVIAFTFFDGNVNQKYL